MNKEVNKYVNILSEKIHRVYDIGEKIKEIYLDMKKYMTDKDKNLFYKSCRKVENISEEMYDDYEHDIDNILKDVIITDRMDKDFELLKDEFKKILKINLEFLKIIDDIPKNVIDYDFRNSDLDYKITDRMLENINNALMPHHPGYCGICDQVCCDGFRDSYRKKAI